MFVWYSSCRGKSLFFSHADIVLDIIRKLFVILMTKDIIILAWLESIPYEFDIIDRDFLARFY